MAVVAYSLCLLTAWACAFLLTRAYRSSRIRLLFWSALCFWGLSVTNALAVIDIFVLPRHDLYGIRLAAGLASVVVLLYGMVWDSK
ncbi:MAG: DUF5985 family protein [Vicinamibacteraceae bacterium]